MTLRSAVFAAVLCAITVGLALVSFGSSNVFWLKMAGGAILIVGAGTMLFTAIGSGERRSQVAAAALLIWGVAQFLPGAAAAVVVWPVALVLWAAVLRVPRRFFEPA